MRTGLGDIIRRVGRGIDAPGPEIEVSPFSGNNASTAAGVIKALTAIGAARRAQANFRQERQDKEKNQYREALEVLRLEQATERVPYTARDGKIYSLSPDDAALRAQADNPLEKEKPERKRGPFNPTAYPWGKNVTSFDPTTGTADEWEAEQVRQAWAQQQAAARAARAAAGVSQVSQAKAMLSALDDEAEQVAAGAPGVKALRAKANAALAVLADPKATPDQKLAAAAVIGAEPGTYEDSWKASQAAEAFIKTTQDRFRAKAIRNQAAKRRAALRILEAGISEAEAQGINPGDWRAELDSFSQRLIEAREE